ncbi:hypothetical protein [Nocardia blacklockiae]|uniref:hypothetical protein n=1 Tax=Nocardia blacklockiae TaxID=480036 RepID=UPI0018950EF0|nr:hypothetical protein [Nocardia blacklockiae]MBF6174206.1 hypothetical protein [Nocardia blacklockiae]
MRRIRIGCCHRVRRRSGVITDRRVSRIVRSRSGTRIGTADAAFGSEIHTGEIVGDVLDGSSARAQRFHQVAQILHRLLRVGMICLLECLARIVFAPALPLATQNGFQISQRGRQFLGGTGNRGALTGEFVGIEREYSAHELPRARTPSYA